MATVDVYLVLYIASFLYFWYATSRQCYSERFDRYVSYETYKWLTPTAILACLVSGVALWTAV